MHTMLEHFEKHGWVVLDLLNHDPVFTARHELQKQLGVLTSQDVSLEDYHSLGYKDPEHTELQIQMTNFFRKQRLGQKVIEAQVPFFKELVGSDLLVQGKPYLRMTRPNCPQDNIGYHRDTFYGGSPYEISVLIPFVDLPAESSLGMLSGSHVLSDSEFPTKQVISDPLVTKGSDKHKLGFLYAPKPMDSAIEKDMQYIPLKLGQALVFNLAIVHGSVVNKGSVTRWSTDIRVMNALAPVDLSSRPDYYESETFHSSPLTRTAHQYFVANEIK